MNADNGIAPRVKPQFAMDRLSNSIAGIVRRFGSSLCASCLTELTADEHGAENVDVRVAVVHLALGDAFGFVASCGRCGAPDSRRNPIIGAGIFAGALQPIDELLHLR